MNYRMISKILGRVMAVEAALMVPPALTAVYYGESPLPFVYTLLIAAALFALLTAPSCATTTSTRARALSASRSRGY